MTTSRSRTESALPTDQARALDPRPARTRAAILAAVERLPQVSPDQVTVATLVRDAGVSRSAFYTQFSGLDDLLIAVLSETALRLGPDENAIQDGTESRRKLVESALNGIVGHAHTRSTFYRAASTWKISTAVHEATRNAYAAQLSRLIRTVREASPTDSRIPSEPEAEMVATFAAGGLIAALTEWVSAGLVIPPGDFAVQLAGMLPDWLTTDPLPTESR